MGHTFTSQYNANYEKSGISYYGVAYTLDFYFFLQRFTHSSAIVPKRSRQQPTKRDEAIPKAKQRRIGKSIKCHFSKVI